MWLLADIVSTGMFLAGIALLTMILLRRFYRRSNRRRSTHSSTRRASFAVAPPAKQQRSLSTAPPDVLRWHVEMHETAREMKAELDSKIRLLQLLTAQARHEADRLEQMLASSVPMPEELPDAAHPERHACGLPGAADRKAEIFALADQGRTAVEIAQQVESPLGDVELILSLRGAH